MRKPRVLAITQLGNPVLRRRAKAVRDPRTPAVRRLVEDMLVTMNRAQGVGIAAPQVGVSLRVFIVAPEPNARYPQAPALPPIPMINPRLFRASPRRVTDWEGCLSIPGLRARVPRHAWVEIAFTTLAGENVRARLSGFVARIFQHEFDHINGRVYLDRVEDSRTFAMEAELARRLAHAR